MNLTDRTTTQSQNKRLALILQSGHLRVWVYVPAIRHYLLLTEEGTLEQEYNPIEFSQFFDKDDFEVLRETIFDIFEGRQTTAVVPMLGSEPQAHLRRHYEVNLSVSRRNEEGQVTAILGIQHDVTDEFRRQQQVNELLMRYHTVFESSLLDMLYYDANGVLRDINERACQAFGVKDRNMVLQGNFLLKNNPFFEGISLDHLENTRASSMVDFTNFQAPHYRIDEFGLKGKMYYESTINPIRSADGRLEGFYMAGREITEMVESVHRLQEGNRQLKKAMQDIEEYITNINYALRVSDVRFVNYYPDSYTLEVSDNVRESKMRLSQLRCIRLATPRFRRNVSSMLNRMDHHTTYTINETIETEIRDKKRRQIWLMLSLVPIKNAEGRIERYFGLCRNMTDMVETERRLAVETKKAQETELLKQAFLTNMSYEIRTPLNTVVGFAELFESDHDAADEPFFVDEIKKSSNTLLLLVNDILFLSRLDANMIEYTPDFIDFSQVFESHCHMGLTSISPEVQTAIENPYNSLVVNIDEPHVGMVIEKLCALAVSTTRKGTISARYEYRRGELTVSIEDTGSGIDAQTMPHIFDRFVRNANEELIGTGLDLPIIQSIVQQMGGTLEVESEPGKGTSVWVSIPCEARQIEKRRDMNINRTEQLLLL